MANQIAQTAQYPIQKPTTASAYLAAVAIPEQYHADLAAQSCRWQPLGLHTREQAARAACLAFIDTLPPEQAVEAGYSIMQPGSPLFDRLLARLPQTSR